MFRPKINVHVLTLKNSMVKLFAATSEQQERSRSVARRLSRNERKRFTGSYRRPLNQCVFPPGVSRAEQRAQCLGLALCGILSKRILLNWWTRSGLSKGGRPFTARLCALLWINLCPRWTLPKHPSFPHRHFLIFCRLCLSFDWGFPGNVFQPELLINVIIFRLACRGFSSEMKNMSRIKPIMTQANTSVTIKYLCYQLISYFVNNRTLFQDWKAVGQRIPPPKSICLAASRKVTPLWFLFTTEGVDPGFNLIQIVTNIWHCIAWSPSNCFVNHCPSFGQ